MGGPHPAGCRIGLAELDLALLLLGEHVHVVVLPLDRDVDDLAIRERNVPDHDLAVLHCCREPHRHASSVAHTRRAPQQAMRQR